jgi:endonuclease-3 related protein
MAPRARPNAPPAALARTHAVLPLAYRRLFGERGHQHWWPGETPFEVVVGAILTQNTAWTNVERAIAALKAAGALDPASILALPQERLAALIRPAGYYNVKARRLREVVRFVVDEAGGRIESLAGRDPAALRASLLAIPGVGRETADSILLYAIGVPSFVVDAYTRRIFGRIGVVDPDADYDAIRAAFEAALPRDAPLFNDYHAQIVAHGKHVCRTVPRCAECGIADLCRRTGVSAERPAKRRGA